MASRASEDQRSCLLWKPALGDQLCERPRLPGLPVRSPGLCGGQGPGVRASSPSGERQPQPTPQVCKENRPTEPFPRSDHGTRSKIEGVVCTRVWGGLFLPSWRRDPGWDSGHCCRRSFKQGQGLGHQVGVGLEGHQGQGPVKACEAAGASLQAGGRAPWYTAAASSPTLSCGAVRRSGRRESGCGIIQAGFRRASWLPLAAWD